jgi:hypothetical protein
MMLSVNRCVMVDPVDVASLEMIEIPAYDSYPEDCWLVVRTKDGKEYTTERSADVDPECPVDPRELMGRIQRLSNVAPPLVNRYNRW